MTEPRKHLLSISVEDYFHAPALRKLVGPRHWNRMESRVEHNTRAALDLLDEMGQQATFFVLGWVAEEHPGVVREIVERGHGVASKGYDPRELQAKPGDILREDLRRARGSIEDAAGQAVPGVRIGGMRPDDTWALDLIAEEGYVFDSSTYPRGRSIANEPWRRLPHVHQHGGHRLLEFPVSTWGSDKFVLPISGGNYLRQLPTGFLRRAFDKWETLYPAPFHMYFHVWELDPDLPAIFSASRTQRLRQYRNLRGMRDKLRTFLEGYRFESIEAHIERADLADAGALSVQAPRHKPLVVQGAHPVEPPPPREPLTVVIPCYNEEAVLPYLGKTLDEMVERHGASGELRFLLVDDASPDDTWAILQRDFAPRADCKVVRHAQNKGVCGAIMTGIGEATTELVASMDCDCSYDPHQLFPMVQLATPDVAVVTASPYHELGEVMGVAPWRLFLSRGLSWMYRRVFTHDLATYTSCFRVYRKSLLADIRVEDGGFLGVVEMLARLDRRGRRIVEFPAVLESRLLGESKMKTLRVIWMHLGFLLRMLTGRVTDDGDGPPQRTHRAGQPDEAPPAERRTRASQALRKAAQARAMRSEALPSP